MDYEAVIGLEVHAQLRTASKLFCGCSTEFGAPPNTQTCPVCLGLPGALPVTNRNAVEMAVKAGLALGCRINPRSIFARKNYFYPDLPKGYQISQYDQPLALDGALEMQSEETNQRFRITRVHLEDDAGKSTHDRGTGTLVNLNRTGVPLIEIVTEPDFRSPEQAYDFLTELRRILLFLEICDGNMEQGSLRCDANISVRSRGAEELGTKTEIKNLNSFRFLKKALEHEIERQARVLSSGGKIHQETRLWDEQAEETRLMRTKEHAHDYRYFPEPDLPPVAVSDELVQHLAQQMPELPGALRQRLKAAYQLTPVEVDLLLDNEGLCAFFERAASNSSSPRSVYNWIAGDLMRQLKTDSCQVVDCPVEPESLARLVQLVESGEISGKIAKSVFEKMYQTGRQPDNIVQQEGLQQISDAGQLQPVIDQILAAHPEKVAAYRDGKLGLMGFFVGQVMRETKGQANPQLVNQLLQTALSAESKS